MLLALPIVHWKRKDAAITRTHSSGGLRTTRGRVCFCESCSLEALAFEECNLGVSILLAGHRIPLALNDKLLHQTRIQDFAAKAFLLQHL